jgi:hypothetical protein
MESVLKVQCLRLNIHISSEEIWVNEQTRIRFRMDRLNKKIVNKRIKN